jgi:tetratricopeptide (TPR) repeat protein
MDMRPLDEIYNETLNKPVTPRESLLLIKALKEKGEPEIVIKACLKALEFFPDDINIRKTLAETYLEKGSIELAEKELERICEKIDELSSLFRLQAELFIKKDRIKEAINSLRLYLAHYSDDQEAAQLVSKLSSSHKGEPSILPTSTLAEIYYKQGELQEAIKIYEQTVKAFPDDEKSKLRLKELREIKEVEGREEAKEGLLKEKKLRLIRVLERWLSDIEQRRAVSLLRQP